MKINLINQVIWLGSFILYCGMYSVVNGQEVDSMKVMDCVTVRRIGQKPSPKNNIKAAPDVIVEVPDDIHIRFELKNNCGQTIYFLSSKTPKEIYPAGFLLYRNHENVWTSRSPAWRRARSLTGITYRWVPLKAGKSIEFEYSDLTLIEGERNIAIYINYFPSHENRVELLAESFSIIRQ